MKHQKLHITLASLLAIASLTIWAPAVLAEGMINSVDLKNSLGKDQIRVEGNRGATFHDHLIIRNTGKTPHTLKLYLQDATEHNLEFNLTEKQGADVDMTQWITLNTSEIKLKPGEEKLVPFSISFPQSAGIGKHVAAIMTSQRITDTAGNVINLDSGIRVHATVTGEPAVNRYKLLNSRQETQDGKFIYRTTLINTGNTDLKGVMEMTNQANAKSTNDRTEITLKPGEDRQIALQTEKSSLGSEHIVATLRLNNDLKTFVLSNGFVFPLNEILLLIFIGLTITLGYLVKQKRTGQISNLLLFVLIGAITTGLVLGRDVFAKSLQTNLFGPDEQAFLTTVKWGSFQDQQAPEGTVTNWSGHLELSEGKMFLVENLHHEDDDRIRINTAGDNLTFRNTTGADNDGIIVLIKAPEGSSVYATLHNNLTGEEIKVPLADTLKTPRYIQYKQQQIEISSENAPDLIDLIDESGLVESTPVSEFGTTPAPIEPIVEMESTTDNTLVLDDLEASSDQSALIGASILADLMGTEDATVTDDETINGDDGEIIIDLQATFDQAQLLEEIKLLAELIKDLPSSPDVISEYVFNSTFISAILADGNSTTVVGSSRLIRVLKDTPLIIREITGTPDSNFLFLPNDTIRLTTQNFSFNERKLSSQEFNDIIFVQRKTSPWSVYFSMSDLTAINGSGLIAASNITFSPGKIDMVSQSGEMPLIEAGAERKMTNKGDLIKLFSIAPQDDSQVIFAMKPRISVFVPPKTLPGLYRAEITFKAI